MDSTNSVDKVLISIRRIIRAIDIHSHKLIQKYGLTIPQIIVLKAIDQANEPTVGAIAKAVNLSQATVTNILTRLQERGLVERKKLPPDKRRVLLKVTDEGRKTLAKSPSLLHEQFVNSFSKLEEWEQLLIISSLMRVAEMMDAAEIDAAPLLSPGAQLPDEPVE